ncbi:MAG: PhoH family protein, partial [Archangium sp.]|nr:PhoH family protein [Archangium sp.]
MKSIHLDLADADVARLLAGAQNEHLKRIERHLGVRVGQRGTALHVTGPDEAVGAAQEVLHQLSTRAEAGHDGGADDVEHALQTWSREGAGAIKALQANAVAVPKGRAVAPRSAAQ